MTTIDHHDDGKAGPLNRGNSYRRVIKPAADEPGIELTSHSRRHHCAGFLIDLGMSPVDVAAFARGEDTGSVVQMGTRRMRKALLRLLDSA